MPLDEVDFAPEQGPQLFFHVKEIAKTDIAFVRERHEHVDVALRVEILAQHRAKQLEPHDLPLLAELLDLFVCHVQMGVYCVHAANITHRLERPRASRTNAFVSATNRLHRAEGKVLQESRCLRGEAGGIRAERRSVWMQTAHPPPRGERALLVLAALLPALFVLAFELGELPFPPY